MSEVVYLTEKWQAFPTWREAVEFASFLAAAGVAVYKPQVGARNGSWRVSWIYAESS